MCRNVCAHITILWMNYVANFVSSLNILYLRRKKTLDCLNRAHILLKTRIYRLDFTASSWSVIFFMLVNWSAFFFHWRNSNFYFAFISNYLPLYVMQSLPIVTENMISTLLLVTEHSFRDVNRQIEEMADKRFFLQTTSCQDDSKFVASSIRHLNEYYWKCADLADHLSDCFGLDFLVVGFCSAIRFIYFLFLTLKYAAEKSVINEYGGFVWPRQEALVFCLAVVGKFYYLCYRCDCVVSEVGTYFNCSFFFLNDSKNTNK